MSSLGVALLAAIVGMPASDDVFVRDLKTIDDVVRVIHLRTESEKRSRLVICLDDGLFEKERWFDAISKEFKGQPFDVVITSRSDPTRRLTKADLVAPPKKGGLDDQRRDSLNDAAATQRDRTPVLDWTRSIVPFARRGAAVVFIASCGPAGSWSAPKSERDLDNCLDPFWHEEEVGAAFAGARTSLWIVAPEAPFSLDAAVTLCRFLPYANRPLFWAGRQLPSRIVKPPDLEPDAVVTPEQLQSMMNKRVPYPRFHGFLPGFIRNDVENESRPETDVPSGTGFWSYARATFLGRGHYFVFAEGHDEFLDPCVRGAGLDALQSPVDRSAKAQWDTIATAPAVKHLREIVAGALEGSRSFFDVTEPRRRSGAAASLDLLRSIDVFETPGTPRTTLVDPCFDQRNRDLWREFSKTLPAPIAAYDRAANKLKHSLEVDAGSWGSIGNRARYDALIESFWLKMSAFHLESLRVLTAEPERFLIQPKKGWYYGVIASESIRLSDCLEAYDGRRISPDVEQRSELSRRFWLESGCLWQVDQSNELFVVGGWDPTRPVPKDLPLSLFNNREASLFSPDYRAQRYDLAPIANLDPSLKTRALDLIEAAREIHDACRGTPWDWLVYYAQIDVYAFVKDPARETDSIPPRPDKKPTDDGPPTPKNSSTGSTPGTKPGSTGGGC